MSQATTWSVPTTGPATPTDYAARDNAALNALLSSHSGASEPAYKVRGTLWEDTTNSVLKKYNGTDWEVVYARAPQVISAAGGDSSDLTSTATTRLSVSFTATAASVLLQGGCTIRHDSATATDVLFSLDLYDMVTASVVAAAVSGETATAAFSFICAPTASLAATGLVLGRAYQVRMQIYKNVAVGPTFPSNMRISGLNI